MIAVGVILLLVALAACYARLAARRGSIR